MAERRYSEEEAARIFERASQSEHSGRAVTPAGQGMTLAQLQEVGREVGIAPDLVARAALALDGARPARRLLGLPIAVGRTIDFGRPLSDGEWERLIVDLRETFDARGRVRTDGSFRQWTNGNLQALLEPTPTGHRLVLRTTNGNARSLIGAGLGLLALAAAVAALLALAGLLGEGTKVLGPAVLGTMGAGMLVAGAARLPAWARLRQRQMDEIASRHAPELASPSTDSGDASSPA